MKGFHHFLNRVMYMFKNTHTNKGFTLIEILVSMTVFVTIVLMGIGIVLTVNKSQKVNQYTREQLDTLSSIMEDIVRNVRVGTNVHCFADYPPADIEKPHSCEPYVDEGYEKSTEIAFEGQNGIAGDPNDQIVYKFGTINGKGVIAKSNQGDFTFGSLPGQRLSPLSVDLDIAKSGFSVLGAESVLDGDTRQPIVFIRMVGTVKYQDTVIPFNLQTAVSLRTSDL